MNSFATLAEAEFDEKILKAARPVVIEFGAPWCAPCKRLEVELEKLAQHFGERMCYYHVNVDESPDMAARLGVMSVPVVLVFNNGQEQQRMIGFQPAVKMIERFFSF